MAITHLRTLPEVQHLNQAADRQSAPVRFASLDILRAITMLLMIFVNDLWSLKDIPAWLGHVERGVDGMGLADTIFPAFLFIVGMSIPLAISSRKQKGESDLNLVLHIASRSLALLVMGLFLVNGESINAAATGMLRGVFYSLSCFSFILIWHVQPRNSRKIISGMLRVAGVIILLTLAFVYRGGEAGNLKYFAIHWWGILGLIGWSYLVSALITVFAGGKYYLPLAAWVLFCAISMVYSAKLIPADSVLRVIPGPILGGTLVALTLGGVLTTFVIQYFRKHYTHTGLLIALLVISAGLALLGYFTRPYWGISKLGATPAWLFMCSAITLLAFAAIYWLADVKGKAHWFRIIKPAGTDTLLCYLMPYFIYAAVVLLGLSLPAVLLTGMVGLAKSLLFALLCILLAGFLSRNGIRLKL